jgi:MFS superfamily sulfate permease-like transporter
LTPAYWPSLTIAAKHLVHLPEIESLAGLWGQFNLPDFSAIANLVVWQVAATLAIVASLETLLSLEATDKLDPLRRVAPTNRELKAQGLGNVLSGLLGGLPITAVIVRSSANINAGAHTKVACFVHGLLLLISVTFIAQYLNQVPLACLAAILLLTGYKLARPALFIELYRKGTDQIVPFVITILAILFTDLLKGMAIGMLCGLYYVVRTNFHAAISLTRDGRNYLLRLQKDVSFLNKALLRGYLDQIEPNSYVIVDARRAQFVDQDILETLCDFHQAASDSDITIEWRGLEGVMPDETAAPGPDLTRSLVVVAARPTPAPDRPAVTPLLNDSAGQRLAARG